MPVASATAERSFSTETFENLCYVDHEEWQGLMYIHRYFGVDLYKSMEVFVSAKTRTDEGNFGQFEEIFLYQSHSNCAWFYVIWNPEMVPDRTILHLVKKNPRPPLSQEWWCVHY